MIKSNLSTLLFFGVLILATGVYMKEGRSQADATEPKVVWQEEEPPEDDFYCMQGISTDDLNPANENTAEGVEKGQNGSGAPESEEGNSATKDTEVDDKSTSRHDDTVKENAALEHSYEKTTAKTPEAEEPSAGELTGKETEGKDSAEEETEGKSFAGTKPTEETNFGVSVTGEEQTAKKPSGEDSTEKVPAVNESPGGENVTKKAESTESQTTKSSKKPSKKPSKQPSKNPSDKPSKQTEEPTKKPTEQVTEQPTEQQTEPPSVVQTPVSMADALFIGDSRTLGIMEYAGIEGADFFCNVGMSVYNMHNKPIDVRGVGSVTLTELLERKQYGKIYVMLGINEIGYALNKTVERYGQLLAWIQEKQPNALLFIEANLHVAKSSSDVNPVENNPAIDRLNAALSGYADGKRRFYMDVNPVFDDENGALMADKTSDCVHLYAKYYVQWGTWIVEETGRLLQAG